MPGIVLVCLLSAALIIVTSATHFEIMTGVAILRRRKVLSKRAEMVVFLGSAFMAHLFGVGLYALAFAWMHYHPEFGSLEGLAGSNATDFFYFSLTCYSTMGFGDVYATGDMRILAGLEGLNGLVLIAWSASFTFIAVERIWRDDWR
ncbi:potassium channel family protein [Sinorhizobium sp. 22678]|uniref:potassium channel family protein n=1 Tax=Sinorhizobium sp. 22678 TaxID=3453955 RepID=UPI003F8584F5